CNQIGHGDNLRELTQQRLCEELDGTRALSDAPVRRLDSSSASTRARGTKLDVEGTRFGTRRGAPATR
ncbi:hypothetical protein KI387_031894, partial [Taxus chinensis]